VNAPILSINARVGFRVAWRNVDYQVTRDALNEWERGLSWVSLVGMSACGALRPMADDAAYG